MAYKSSNMNAEIYIDWLESELLDIVCDLHGNEKIFQQDNAPIQVTNKTKKFFNSRQTKILRCPSLRPDHNPIEDLWVTLSAKIFANSKQYYSLRRLKNATVDELDQTVLKQLVESMPRRIQLEKINKGNTIFYLLL